MLTRRIVLALLRRCCSADAGRRAGEAEGRRDLLDPRRLRDECRRRPRRRRRAGRPERRRACLSAHAGRREDARRRQGSCSSTGSASRAGSTGWSRRPAPRRRSIVATKGVKPRKAEDDHGHGEADPHAWQSVANAKIYVGEHPRCADRRRSGRQGQPTRRMPPPISAKLDALDAEVKAAIAKIPADRRRIITTHDAFGYFAAAYGVAFIAPQGVSTEVRGVGQGRRADHHPDQEAEDPGGVPRERHRPAPARAHRRGDRRAHRRHALFRRADRREGAGADLHRHDAPQCEAARRRAGRADAFRPALSPPMAPCLYPGLGLAR